MERDAFAAFFPEDGEGGRLGVAVGRAVERGAGRAFAAGDAAAKGAVEAVEVGDVLRTEGVGQYSVVGCGCGLCSHAAMVGRAAFPAQRADVTGQTAAEDSEAMSPACRLGLGERAQDLRLGFFWGDVFPEPQHAPTGFSKSEVRYLVPVHVPLELGYPICLVGLRDRSVLRTAVPEAAVDEHGYPSPSEGDVTVDCLAVRPTDCIVLPEPKAASVQQGSKCELRFRVRAAVGTHRFCCRRASWCWVRERLHLGCLVLPM